MRVIVAHNFYQQPGGEDQVFADEVKLLKSQGHAVEQFTVHNDSINGRGRLGLLRDTIWNRQAAAEIRDLVVRTKSEVVHFHNTFPLISPAGYSGARTGGAAVVQTLHNFRLVCPQAVFLRDGKGCQDCLAKRFAWPAVLHGCYRGSRVQSAVVAGMLAVHHGLGTWARTVDAFIALTEFARRTLIEGGLPAERVAVKPNFLRPDPGAGDGRGGFALFVGRLSEEKGIEPLLEAWRHLGEPVTLKIIGDGPLAASVHRAAESDRRIRPLGRRPLEEVCQMMGDAGCLVVPSPCYENLPRTIVEALAKGTPAVASRMGAMIEVIEEGRTGLLFEPGNPADLAAKVRELLSADATRREATRRAARERYEQRYTAEANYRQLMSIYERALATRRAEGVCYPAWECKA